MLVVREWSVGPLIYPDGSIEIVQGSGPINTDSLGLVDEEAFGNPFVLMREVYEHIFCCEFSLVSEPVKVSLYQKLVECQSTIGYRVEKILYHLEPGSMDDFQGTDVGGLAPVAT